MGKIIKDTPSPFNSPFEIGFRMVYLLSALGRRGADLQKLVLLDYAVIYSEDLGGPASLHTPVPFRGSEIHSRRALLQQSLHLMSVKGLVGARMDSDGITYIPGEQSRSLVASQTAQYARKLDERCNWAAAQFGDSKSDELTATFLALGHRWGAEFETLSI
ncbi:ABC-three component system middle component 2 [Burkholderia aenigmatica]|uniref:ABC-three component system middle component 2 n=1 Tax=Burkholderia aenigmatica TaxID=2015348 RepID=UPI00264E80FB|nr:ABC-three component system middle component 2 [Burkholderia aenigmatica]MDN7877756.1 threonine transporter RhtB [Burkholderia aenigmatica]